MSENEIKPVRRYDVDQFGMDEDANGYYVTYADHKSAIDRLTAERDAAVADADRYRWLRDNCQEAADYFATAGQLYFGTYGYGGIDAAIDAAMVGAK